MTDPLTKVRFSFTSPGEPGNRWRVVHARIREAISEPYSAVIELAHEDLTVDANALLGENCEFTIARDTHTRRLCGVVHRVEHLGVKQGHLVCRVHVAPALRALAQRIDSYIFQAATVPEILAVTLAEDFAPFSREYDLAGLEREYPSREYCVQYRETELDFVQRLMAEEGIYYYFDHAGSTEKLMLVDHNAALPALETMDGQPVGIEGPEGGTSAAETVRHFELAHQTLTTSATVRDFDWTQPRLGLPGKGLTGEDHGTDVKGRNREAYEYPAPLTLTDYDTGSLQYTLRDSPAQATLRKQLLTSNEKRFKGDGYVTTFAPGYTFAIAGHRDEAVESAHYLLTVVEHECNAPEELTSDVNAEEHQRERYRNTFECLATDVEFRPTRAVRRAKITGIQTATVVGPAGEEIWTDEHGRIKVQFHWDREGKRDENASCWVRVAQTWAGPGWGFLFIPRIGMEVVVQFLEGNPDRPLVTGCVYNGENRPPYQLPDEKTKSTIKTNSSHTSGGYNELRFEDLAGSEEVYLQAQKDFNELVKHNHSTTVNNDQSNTVHGNQTETIDKNQTRTVHKNRTTTIDGNDSQHIKGQQNIVIDGGGSQCDDPPPARGAGLKVTGEYTVEATQKITLKVGGSTIVIDSGSITLTAGGHAVLRLDANAHMRANGGGDLLLDANCHMRANGGGDLLLDANCHMRANGGGDLLLDANAHLHGNGGGDLLLTADADLHSNGGSALILTGTADLHGSGGGKVFLTGDAQVTGGTVKLNA